MGKEWLLAHFNLFKDKVLGAMSASAYARVLPLAPGIGDGQEVFSRPVKQASKLWKKINDAPPAGFTGPLVLLDGVAQAEFEARVQALAADFDAVVVTRT